MNVQANGKNIDWKRIGVIAVVLLVGGYQYSLPTLEKWFDRDLPSLTGDDNDQQAGHDGHSDRKPSATDSRYDAQLPASSTANSKSTDRGTNFRPTPLPSSQKSQASANGEFLRSIGRDKLESPAGLIYGMGPRREHRVDHVMRHGRDMPDRPVHSVFEGDKNTILATIDEAYELVKSNSSQVRSSNSRGNDEHTIRMNRKVGYEGGQKGKRKGYPSLKSVKLILDGNRVITAYPYR